ncbi:hypothetical protein D9613_009244 [Agrocybe pediades]|uniref:Uncharacterized protein n=1 Tax=Agrocybe pediades TaxID=84607 RepID=A0A8H4R324_9AGAR|nr:hypothetical protein D9613_009244 [Agrocybe pediades]
MHIYPIHSRDSDVLSAPPQSQVAIFDTTCSSSSLVKWCPVDIVVWVLLILVVIFVSWKVYSTNRVGPSKELSVLQKHRRRKGHRLDLPYPSSSSNDHLPAYTYADSAILSNNGSAQCPSGAVDPYHVVDTIDNSRISKDADFNGASVPRPVLEQRKAGSMRRLSDGHGRGLGLGIDMASMTHPSPAPAYSEKISPEDSLRDTASTPSPKAAHVHNARWDT